MTALHYVEDCGGCHVAPRNAVLVLERATGILRLAQNGGEPLPIAAGIGLCGGARGGEQERFLSSTAPTNYAYTATLAAFNAAMGGSVQVTTGALAGDFAGVHHLNAHLDPAREPRWACALGRSATVTTSIVVAGLTSVADVSAGAPDGAYFRATDGGTLLAVTRTGGAEVTTETGVTLGASEVRRLAIEVGASEVRFYVDGRRVAVHPATLPAGALFSFAGVEATAAAATRALRVAWMASSQRTDS